MKSWFGRAKPATDAERIAAAESKLATGAPLEALDALLPLAKAGNAVAQRHVGTLLLSGVGEGPDTVIAPEPGVAIKWLTAAATAGDAPAQLALGNASFKGEHVPQSDAEAMTWYRRAAEQGLADAQDMLSWMLADADARQPDHVEALRWAQAAADQGHAAAMTRIGLFHHHALGVPRAPEVAIDWWRRAAHLGEADAQALLGAAYHLGQGVPRDPVRAYAWLRRARWGGSKLVERYIYAVRASLDADELAEAEAQAERPLAQEPVP